MERYCYADRLLCRGTVWHETVSCSETATHAYQTSRHHMSIWPAAVTCLHVSTANTVLGAAACKAAGCLLERHRGDRRDLHV